MNLKQIRQFIQDVLTECNLWSPHVGKFMFNLGLVESKYKYLYQLSEKQTARGFWQVEPFSAIDNFRNFLRFPKNDKMREDILRCTGIDPLQISSYNINIYSDLLTNNIAFNLLMARVKCYRVPLPIPVYLEEQAAFWKKYYNTNLGKGKESDFIKTVLEHEGI